MSFTVDPINGFALKDGEGNVIAVYETQEQADEVKDKQNASGGRKEAEAAIDLYNLYSGPKTYAINYDIEASVSLASLDAALEQIRSDYGINPNT